MASLLENLNKNSIDRELSIRFSYLIGGWLTGGGNGSAAMACR
jgi:hypothetical protein